MKKEPLDRPIFVVGHPRSGTTLLASMLGRHPDIVSTPESLYLNMVRFQIAPVLSQGPEAVVSRIESSPMRFLILDRPLLLEALQDLPALDERTVFQTLLECFRAMDGKPRLLEKTPLHLRSLDDLFAWFPDARVVWIMRDGRACVSSLMKVSFASSDPTVLARQWVRNVAIGRMLAAKHVDQVKIINYEDLISDPRNTMSPLFGFLGVDPSEHVLDHDREVRTVKPTEVSWKGNISRPLMPNRADAWRAELTPQVLQRLDMIMGPTLRDCGYAPSTEHRAPRWRQISERMRSRLVYNQISLRLMLRGHGLAERLKARLKPLLALKLRGLTLPFPIER